MIPQSECRDYQYFPAQNELLWRGLRYRCVVGGHGLEADLRIDHGPVTSVEPRFDAMGGVYVQVFFSNRSYTGAQIRSSYDVKKSFSLINKYVKIYNGNITPLFFNICFDNLGYNALHMNISKKNKASFMFPGARKMGLSFKESVEKFIEWKYSERVGKGLTKADIFREDPKLYKAIGAYKSQFGVWPIDIPSERDIVQRGLEKLYEQGVEALTRKERTAVSRKFNRALSCES